VYTFWEHDLDIYVDNYRYCSTCQKKYQNTVIHCYACDKCKDSSKFNKQPWELKMCIKCEETYNNASGPAPGYSSVGGYIGSGSFGFKTKDYTPTNKILNDALDEPTNDALDETTNDALDETTNDTLDETTNDTLDEPTNDALDEPTNDVLDEPTNDALDEPTNDVLDEPTNETIVEPTIETIVETMVTTAIESAIKILNE
jgi:hypothetical protein